VVQPLSAGSKRGRAVSRSGLNGLLASGMLEAIRPSKISASQPTRFVSAIEKLHNLAEAENLVIGARWDGSASFRAPQSAVEQGRKRGVEYKTTRGSVHLGGVFPPVSCFVNRNGQRRPPAIQDERNLLTIRYLDC